MNFLSTTPYVDVCVEYAHAYSETALSAAFSRILSGIARRHADSQYANGNPIYIEHGPFEAEMSPTNIKDGLWHFFGNRLTRSWSTAPFTDYFAQVKVDMMESYVPFRSFSEEDFQDAMRLRVYQDAMNIIAGRSLDGASSKTYSVLERVLWRLRRTQPPKL
jgi:hypothetical protein